MPSQRLVAISQDNGQSWTTTKGNGIWVIVPGAGTFQNRRTYLQLESQMIKKVLCIHGKNEKLSILTQKHEKVVLYIRQTGRILAKLKCLVKRKTPLQVLQQK